MDPILNEKLLGIPYANAGTNLERNALIGVVKDLISQNRYTIDYIIDYCTKCGYQYKNIVDVFQALTGINPQYINENNEYYQNPVFVPSMTLAWGYKKSSHKTEAYYVVPFEYGYSVMSKNETEAPVSEFQFITLDEAINKLKTLVNKVQTIYKIITDNCLLDRELQLNSNDVHNTVGEFTSNPVVQLKKDFINKLINLNTFEKKIAGLMMSDEISQTEANEFINWANEQQDEEDEDKLEEIEFGNIKNDEVGKFEEKNKEILSSSNFDEIMEELYTTIGDEYADKNILRKIYNKNIKFLNKYNKEEAAQKLYELYLGFNEQDIKGRDKFERDSKTSLKKKAADEEVEMEDIDEDHKDIIKDEIEKINETDFNELVSDVTPQDFLENEDKQDQTEQLSEKVDKVIREFTSKFEQFVKYKVQLSTYKLQILNQGIDNDKMLPIEDIELNAQALLQIIINIAPVDSLNNYKKGLVLFSINKDKIYFNGTVRFGNNEFTAFSEEGFDTIFQEDEKEPEEVDDII